MNTAISVENGIIIAKTRYKGEDIILKLRNIDGTELFHQNETEQLAMIADKIDQQFARKIIHLIAHANMLSEVHHD